MQIGFDVGATKIESVVLEDSGEENFRERTECPKDYNSVIKNISEITKKVRKKIKHISSCWCLSSWSSFTSNRIN